MPTLPLWLEPVERLLEAGGAVLVVLALVAVVVFAMAIERWWYYRISWRRARMNWFVAGQPEATTAVGVRVRYVMYGVRPW